MCVSRSCLDGESGSPSAKIGLGGWQGGPPRNRFSQTASKRPTLSYFPYFLIFCTVGNIHAFEMCITRVCVSFTRWILWESFNNKLRKRRYIFNLYYNLIFFIFLFSFNGFCSNVQLKSKTQYIICLWGNINVSPNNKILET